MNRPYRHCQDCRGSGWRKGKPVLKNQDDGTVREYQNAVERCPCGLPAGPIVRAMKQVIDEDMRPEVQARENYRKATGLDGQSAASGEREEESK